MAAPDTLGAARFVLRDGRTARLALAQSTDEADIGHLVGSADAARCDVYGAAAAAIVARDETNAELIGTIAYTPTGELAGAVDGGSRGIGLGTLLLHEAAEHARAAGFETLEVALHAGAGDTAEMLRDAGLAAHWQIDFPVTRVTLRLGGARPGWATPRRPAG